VSKPAHETPETLVSCRSGSPPALPESRARRAGESAVAGKPHPRIASWPYRVGHASASVSVSLDGEGNTGQRTDFGGPSRTSSSTCRASRLGQRPVEVNKCVQLLVCRPSTRRRHTSSRPSALNEPSRYRRGQSKGRPTVDLRCLSDAASNVNSSGPNGLGDQGGGTSRGPTFSLAARRSASTRTGSTDLGRMSRSSRFSRPAPAVEPLATV